MRAGKPARQPASGRSVDRAGQRGFTYLWLLAALAVLGVAMAAIGPLWAQQAQREREAELLCVGVAYASAIEQYAAMSPGGARSLPRRIDDLLLDPRFTAPVRHLRRAYGDPMNPGQPMALITGSGGELQGVRSTSTQAPLRQIAWTDGRHTIAPAGSYSDWHFLAQVSP